jgi:hypothetical protein
MYWLSYSFIGKNLKSGQRRTMCTGQRPVNDWLSHLLVLTTIGRRKLMPIDCYNLRATIHATSRASTCRNADSSIASNSAWEWEARSKLLVFCIVIRTYSFSIIMQENYDVTGWMTVGLARGRQMYWSLFVSDKISETITNENVHKNVGVVSGVWTFWK